MVHSRISLFSLAVRISLVGIAQAEINLPEVSPPTPNATSVHVYWKYSVNYYTGSVNLEKPLIDMINHAI